MTKSEMMEFLFIVFMLATLILIPSLIYTKARLNVWRDRFYDTEDSRQYWRQLYEQLIARYAEMRREHNEYKRQCLASNIDDELVDAALDACEEKAEDTSCSTSPPSPTSNSKS